MWNPGLYNKLKAVHFASFADLFELVTCRRPNLRVLDLGCGTGELTRRLADGLPDADVLGVDSSPEMLLEARAFATPRLRFEARSIPDAVARKAQWDLVFSHTALHWVADHRTLFPKIFAAVAAGGQLALQLPVPEAHFFVRDLDELASREPFREPLRGRVSFNTVLTSVEYATLLFEAGAKDIVVFDKVYPHVLPDAGAMFEFAAGTGMIAYLRHLPEELRPSFRDEYRKLLRERHPATPLFFPYQRMFLAASF